MSHRAFGRAGLATIFKRLTCVISSGRCTNFYDVMMTNFGSCQKLGGLALRMDGWMPVTEGECRGRNTIYLLNGQNTCQRIIRPISSLLGGIPKKWAVYLPLEGLWTVIVKRFPFHVYWETKIKIVAVSTHFGVHNGETERSRHRKKTTTLSFQWTLLWATNKHNRRNTIALTLISLTLSHFLLFD